MSPGLRPRYLEVHLHGVLCGHLCEVERTCRFVPAEAFRGDPLRPTLSLSLTFPGNEALTAAVLSNPFHPALYNTNGALPPYFAGLLPESELRKRLEATRRHAEDRDDFGILAAAGDDLPGAVVVRPAPIDALPAHVRTVGVTGGADNLEIAVIEGATEGAASVSGVQNKLALSTAHAGKRYTLPTHGRLSDLIAKLPARNDDSQVFNEYVSMQLAQAAGVAVAPCRPVPLAAIEVEGLAETLGADLHFLAVDRFDREPGGRVHAEDGCQVLTRMPSRKYAGPEAYAALVQLLERLSVRGIEDVRQFFLRQAVNTLLGNSDAHLKNFSFLYRNGIAAELSPAYDIVSVAALPGFAGFGQNVAIDRQQRAQTLQTYRDFARQARIAERIATAAVKDAVAMAHERWPALLDQLPAPAGMRAAVLARLATLPLAQRGRG
ncbi:type II toxin-antitoxin system HipA family toxin [Cupriavidus sp. 30B13]|uniref:type II toxin-antitoxin system HipA family toxin n=1 Tax=Cupriavidus sp. 30B13 TaxID=3384241 RepID=UPI003B9170D6